jgi:hypothetical protein
MWRRRRLRPPIVAAGPGSEQALKTPAVERLNAWLPPVELDVQSRVQVTHLSAAEMFQDTSTSAPSTHILRANNGT